MCPNGIGNATDRPYFAPISKGPTLTNSNPPSWLRSLLALAPQADTNKQAALSIAFKDTLAADASNASNDGVVFIDPASNTVAPFGSSAELGKWLAERSALTTEQQDQQRSAEAFASASEPTPPQMHAELPPLQQPPSFREWQLQRRPSGPQPGMGAPQFPQMQTRPTVTIEDLERLASQQQSQRRLSPQMPPSFVRMRLLQRLQKLGL